MIDDLNDMLIFAEVVRTGSLTRAGASLSMPKATVSRRLTAMEQRLGSRLLDKTTRRLELTEIGAAYYERCQPILEQVEEARDFASQITTHPCGRLRVTTPADMASLWLAPALSSFCAKYPDIVLELDLTSRLVDLIAERIDVAIRAGKLEDSSLVSRSLGELTHALYASPDYLIPLGTPKTPDDLARYRFVLLRGARRLRDSEILTHGDERSEVQLQPSVIVNTVAMMLEFAVAGLGIAALPETVAKPYLAERRLVRVLPGWAPPSHEIHLVMPSRRFIPRKSQVFIEHIVACAPTLTAFTPVRRP